jgi:drug/metabolite transporter (DMT)-like permease
MTQPAPDRAMAPPAIQRARRLKAIGLMAGAVTVFAGLDASAKWLVMYGGLSVWEAVYARYATNLLLLLIVINPITTPGLFRTRRPVLQLVRAIALLGSTAFNFSAMPYLQLADLITIMFSAPFWTALIAGIFLGQWIGPRRWIAIAVGFAGVLIVTRPGLGNAIHWAAGFSIAASIVYAAYNIMSRVLAQTENLKTTILIGALVPTLVLSPFVLPGFTPPTHWLTWVLMFVTGLCGAIGHTMLVYAHRDVSAQDLAPFIYVQLVSMTAFGYIVFGDLPGLYTLLGGAIIVGSGLWLLALERKGVA